MDLKRENTQIGSLWGLSGKLTSLCEGRDFPDTQCYLYRGVFPQQTYEHKSLYTVCGDMVITNRITTGKYFTGFAAGGDEPNTAKFGYINGPALNYAYITMLYRLTLYNLDAGRLRRRSPRALSRTRRPAYGGLINCVLL